MNAIKTAKFGALALGAVLTLPGPAAAMYDAPPADSPVSAPAPRTTSAHPRLNRFLRKIRENKVLVNAEVRTRKASAEEARQFQADLNKLDRKARALAKTTKDLMEDSEKSLEAELDQLVAKYRAKIGS